MMQYSVHPRDRIFVKGYGFLSFAKNLSKDIGKIISKNLNGKYSHKLLDLTEQSATGIIKTIWKKVIQSQQKQVVIWLVTKLLIVSRKSQKIHHRIIRKRLEMSMIKKYLNIYISRRKTKLLII